ncbi:hypothetical protein [Bacillus mycoides]|uniref:hypothetical protein n=1 Tax=Bacillus mycoides TaxID=1405 RepID=UPI003672174A
MKKMHRNTTVKYYKFNTFTGEALQVEKKKKETPQTVIYQSYKRFGCHLTCEILAAVVLLPYAILNCIGI